jgi:beta-galactosidase/beta-glucuronidase
MEETMTCAVGMTTILLALLVVALHVLAAPGAESPAVPRPEYPRPQLVREPWVNLNGEWEFEVGPRDEERMLSADARLARRIVVPFPPESRLSGVGNRDFMPCVWYRRRFAVPPEWRGRRVWLHFGAVDYEATVWVNGTRVGAHRGGYTPFAFDIAGCLRHGENVVLVRAADDTPSDLQPTGKQSKQLESAGCHYTRTTGIWQTVWLETTPDTFIRSLRLIPNLEGGWLGARAAFGGFGGGLSLRLTVRAGNDVVAETTVPATPPNCAATLPLAKVHAWSPSDPFLYDVEAELLDGDAVVDRVQSYFGLRSIALASPAILLNGQPLFQRLVLDQGYYPDGIYTAPSDDALRRDIELAQAVGFNGARLHQKVFEPRFLYWADRLGYLVWGEFPDWGADHTSPEAMSRVLAEWGEALDRDVNHPCIVGWCPFNETPEDQRGDLIRLVYETTKAMDPTRPVIDTSGYTHVMTDVDDCHSYEQDPNKFAALFAPFAEGGPPYRNHQTDAPHRGQPFMVSEFGGTRWSPGEGGAGWGYGDAPTSVEQFHDRFRRLTETLLSHPRIAGYCYTQLYDIEQEQNGLYTYDRQPKFDANVLREIQKQTAAIER